GSGVPSSQYSYQVAAYDFRNGQSYNGTTNCNGTASYPNIPVPQNLSASKGTFPNSVEVSWMYNTNASVDSFNLENVTTGMLISLPGGQRSFTEIVNDDSYSEYEYQVRAERTVNGISVYSEWTAIEIGYASIQRNGDDEEDLLGGCTAHRLGFSVATDGDWAVAGAPEGEEQINIYRQVEGGWQLFQEIPSPIPDEDLDFGYAVDIDGDQIVVGCPKSTIAYIYQFDGQTWGYPKEVIYAIATLPDADEKRFGHAVDIQDDRLLISAPFNNDVYYYEKVNGQWESIQKITGTSFDGWFGYGLALDGNYLAVASKGNGLFNSGPKVIAVWERVSNTWNFKQNLNPGGGLVPQHGLQFRTDNLDMEEEYLVIGDPNFDNGTGLSFGVGAGRGIIYKRDGNNNYSLESTIGDPDLIAGDAFGHSIAIKRIPSPTDLSTYVIAGAPGRLDQNVFRSGAAYIYSDLSGSWAEFDQLEPIVLAENDEYGHAVDLSDVASMVGIPLRRAYDRGAVEIKNLIQAPKQVDATDGLSLQNDPSKTTISWQFEGYKDFVFGFNIYRDDEFLTFRNIATTTDVGNNILVGEWDDNSGNPGQQYVYTVKAINNNIPTESLGSSNDGYNQADGIIIGSVRTEVGFIPVPGVTIHATAIVEGDIYTYETTTLPNGDYIFNDLFYDSDPNVATVYTVSASLNDNIIVPQNTDQATLNSLNDPVQSVINFIDQTAYVIKGRVTQPNVDCPLVGVEIDQIVNGDIQAGLGAVTDENGEYALIINPNQTGLNQLRIRI
ncbi:MAG: hypothetical protein AAGK97_06720, partial [Bacteroidota bacterium]